MLCTASWDVAIHYVPNRVVENAIEVKMSKLREARVGEARHLVLTSSFIVYCYECWLKEVAEPLS